MLDAAQHHSKSLQGFRQGIDQMSEKNSEALFITSAFTFLYAFVTFGTLHSEFEEGANSATRTLRVLGADWIPLVRGVSTVLKPTYESLKHGPFSCMFEMGNWDSLDPDDVSGPEDKEILRLQEIWKGGEDAAVYDKTLYLLRKYCAWVKQFQPNRDDSHVRLKYNQDCSGPFIWASLSPEQYFKLLHQRQPSALIIFAYFGAVLSSLDRYWWMEGCGASIVGVVDECLGPYWTPFLEWPKKTVGLDWSWRLAEHEQFAMSEFRYNAINFLVYIVIIDVKPQALRRVVSTQGRRLGLCYKCKCSSLSVSVSVFVFVFLRFLVMRHRHQPLITESIYECIK